MLSNPILMISGIVFVAVIGYLLKALSFSGAIGTIIVGCFISLGFKGEGLLLIGAFFASSSLWSKIKKKQKTSGIIQKGSRRDIIQVFANGAIPASLSLVYYLYPHEWILVGFITAIAVANSDTWASEIGPFSKTKPIHILTLRKVEAGTSGAVSNLGTIASFLGSLFIAIIGLLLFEVGYIMAGWITLFGMVGCFLDTIVGATVQAQYTCKKCGQTTELTEHCKESTVLTKGIRIVNNDLVNVMAIILATTVSMLGWKMLF
ncbi:DUF92 domain-containing protein [Bacillus alkalisoli]|uniref:DUF92 domain-containing protein n=1 Tax=Bacillus alkalisoli TaxID=2011008 RepID=UPI000C234CD0|nr:DUF92 domain-containing protein [Bacillus alkalisoli]